MTSSDQSTTDQPTTDGEQFGNVLVFARDFHPNTRFRIVGRLAAGITVEMLRGPAGQSVPVLTQPDDFDGYVISSTVGTSAFYSFLFAEQFLLSEARYSFGSEATYFSSVLNLLEVPIHRVGDE